VSGKPTDALIETLRDAAGRGELHDFAPGLADMDLDPANGATWPPEREVAAELLRSILLDPDLRPDPRGLRLRGALVTGILDLDHVALPCPLVLIRSHFRQTPTFEYATLPHLTLARCHLPGLSLNGARVDGGALLRGLTVTGEVRARGAQISGQLDLQDATLTNDNGDALSLDGARVGGGAFLRGLTATGEVRARGAQITGQLGLQDATLTNDNGDALSLEALTVRALFLEGLRVEGRLNLTRAEIGDLVVDDSPVAGLPSPLFASGWQVQDMHGRLRRDRRSAATWLSTQPVFVAQPWHALADVYERNGQPADARRLRFDAARRTTKTAPPWSKPARWAYGLLVGYGYYPLTAAIWLVAALIIASAVIATHTKTFVANNPLAAATAIADSSKGTTTPAARASPGGLTTVTGATACASLANRYPCLRPLLFSLDVVLPPTVSAGQAAAWRPTANWIAYLLTGLKASGWMLTALLLAGVTGLLRKV